MRTLLLCLALLLSAVPVAAQTQAVGTERLLWDQPAADLATAQAYQYAPLLDTATPPAQLVPFVGVTCAGSASPFTCGIRLPPLTTGLHSVRVIAATTVGGTVLSSAPSAPLALLIMAVPAVPQNVRLGP